MLKKERNNLSRILISTLSFPPSLLKSSNFLRVLTQRTINKQPWKLHRWLLNILRIFLEMKESLLRVTKNSQSVNYTNIAITFSHISTLFKSSMDQKNQRKNLLNKSSAWLTPLQKFSKVFLFGRMRDSVIDQSTMQWWFLRCMNRS